MVDKAEYLLVTAAGALTWGLSISRETQLLRELLRRFAGAPWAISHSE
jgi:hypothetical protein